MATPPRRRAAGDGRPWPACFGGDAASGPASLDLPTAVSQAAISRSCLDQRDGVPVAVSFRRP
ncbi:MAG: hypothetical protein OZSIB_3682 [Candidatus Ozemobacter sibiricus]|jgi:hypothetical protein|uniref:Uncharacterized protein n=1 Tax=Candidatus Ozemobacter sibiricus TaxID=2268124 RepID=A0A367ZPW5_9BACT|nr:MAG: hypothetical protein OZSIB_3682 [Candidatus Ozemobacter sibiricus]